MFQVRRYTGDNSQHDGPPASTRVDLLNKLVERAKSRAKQARFKSRDSSTSSPSSNAVGSPATAAVQHVGSKGAGLQGKVEGRDIHHTDDTVPGSDPGQENSRVLLKKRPRVESQGRSIVGDDTTQSVKENKIRKKLELGESNLKDTRLLGETQFLDDQGVTDSTILERLSTQFDDQSCAPHTSFARLTVKIRTLSDLNRHGICFASCIMCSGRSKRQM